MIAQLFLSVLLLGILLYAWTEYRRAPAIGIAAVLAAGGGLYFVWFPSHATNLAEFVGIGRGVDLIIYVWVVIQGMFNPGTPVLDLVTGLVIIGIFTGVILYGGLLATIATLATHFMLLRAPLTLELSSWRAAPGITYVIVIAGVGLGAAYVARTAARVRPAEAALQRQAG